METEEVNPFEPDETPPPKPPRAIALNDIDLSAIATGDNATPSKLSLPVSDSEEPSKPRPKKSRHFRKAGDAPDSGANEEQTIIIEPGTSVEPEERRTRKPLPTIPSSPSASTATSTTASVVFPSSTGTLKFPMPKLSSWPGMSLVRRDTTLPRKDKARPSVGAIENKDARPMASSSAASVSTPTADSSLKNLADFPISPRSKVVLEIFQTEQTYVQTLDTIVDIFLTPLRNEYADMLDKKDVAAIFSNVEMLRDLNSNLLVGLSERLATWRADNVDEHRIGELFLEMIPKFPMYTIYCNNFDAAIQEITRLEKKKKEFKDFTDERTSNPRCNGLRLQALLITPVQRIPRYMLLFKELVEKTDVTHPDYEPLQQTANKFRELADFVNNSIRDFENAKKMSNLKKNISGLEALESSARTLIKEGPASLITTKKKFQCVLFNDILVFAVRNESKVYEVQVVLALDTIWFEDLEDLDPQTTKEDALEIYTPERPYIMYCGSLSAKKLWMNSLRKAIAEMIKKLEDDITVRGQREFEYRDGSLYLGDWYDGQRHGQGRLIFPNKASYEGSFVNDLRQGSGTMIYHTGEKYTGQWMDDKPHGAGVLTLVEGNVFYGNWQNGLKHGTGRIEFSNGDIFVGEFQLDRICGHGTLTCANGVKYEGEWLDDQWHGEGHFKTQWFEYEGEFRANCRDGYGEALYSDGSKYAGEWKDDKRHGRGLFTTKLGLFYQGRFFADQYDGEGVLVFPNRDRYEGEFRQGQRHGKGVFTYSWGDKYEGQWDNDLFHGQGAMEYATGEIYKGSWVRGKREGLGQCVYPNGSQYDGQWKNNQQEGDGILVYADGSVYEGLFVNNKRHGQGTWAGVGNTRYTGEWAFDQKEGRGTMITDSGKYEGMFKSNMRHGAGMFTTLVGTRFEGTWHLDQKMGKGKLTDVTGRTELLSWRANVLVGTGVEVVAPDLPLLHRPGHT